MLEYIDFLNYPLSKWNGWTLISFVILILGIKFLIHFIYIFTISLFGTIGLSFRTLVDPNKNRFVAIIQAPLIFIFTILISLIACTISSLLFTIGINSAATSHGQEPAQPPSQPPQTPIQQPQLKPMPPPYPFKNQ